MAPPGSRAIRAERTHARRRLRRLRHRSPDRSRAGAQAPRHVHLHRPAGPPRPGGDRQRRRRGDRRPLLPDRADGLPGRLARGGGRRPRHAGRPAQGGAGVGGRGDPHPPPLRRQVLRQVVPLLGRPARRRRLGGERPLGAPRGLGASATARSTTSPSPTARRSRSSRWWGRSASATPAPPSASGPIPSSSIRRSSACRKIKHSLRAKAVLCPGVKIRFVHEGAPEDDEEWLYQDGLPAYLIASPGRRAAGAGGAVRRPFPRQGGGGRLGGRLAARRAATWWRRATSTSSPRPRAGRTSTVSAPV